MKVKLKVLTIAVIAATGGLLFGFDTGVISGALPFLKQYWQMSDTSIEWITTTVLIGAVVGALGSGRLSDILGRKRMIITVGIFFFQQFSGVNTIIYYSPIIFNMAGIVSNTASIVPAIIIGSVNVLACLFSVFMLDRVGRRKLYFAGIIGMIPSLALLGACFHFKEALGSNLPVFAVLSIGSLAHWGFNAIIAFTFLKLVNSLGIDYTFYMYAFVCLAGLVWGYFYIPETKGKSLEDIEKFWRAEGSARKL